MTDYAWNSAASGNWSDAGNWTPGGGPPGSGDTALFDSTTGPCTINVIGDLTDLGITITSSYTSDIVIDGAEPLPGLGYDFRCSSFTCASDRTFTCKSGMEIYIGTADFNGSSGSEITFTPSSSSAFTFYVNSGTNTYDYTDFTNVNLLLVSTSTFTNCDFQIASYIEPSSGTKTTFDTCVIDNYTEGTDWYYYNVNPDARIDFVNSYCVDLAESIHYRAGYSGDYGSRLEFEDGLQMMQDNSQSLFAVNKIQSCKNARKTYRGGRRMYEMGITPIDYTPDDTIRQIAETMDTVAISTYRRFISKAIIGTPVIRYNMADEREIRWLVNEIN